MDKLSLDTKLDGIIISHEFSTSPNKEDPRSIVFNGQFDFTGVTIQEALNDAVRTAAIKAQGPVRSDFEALHAAYIKAGEKIEKRAVLVAEAGRKPKVDSMEVIKARYRAAETQEEKDALIALITAS